MVSWKTFFNYFSVWNSHAPIQVHPSGKVITGESLKTYISFYGCIAFSIINEIKAMSYHKNLVKPSCHAIAKSLLKQLSGLSFETTRVGRSSLPGLTNNLKYLFFWGI